MRVLSVLEIIGLLALVFTPLAIGVCFRLDQSMKTENDINLKTNSPPEANIMHATTDEGNVSGNGTIPKL